MKNKFEKIFFFLIVSTLLFDATEILFAAPHPADGITTACGAANYKICIDEVTSYGACWKSAPTVPSGCPTGANLNDAVRAGTLWGASADGSYHYDSMLSCPMCYAPGAGGGSDPTPPANVALTFPTKGKALTGTVTYTGDATDNVGVTRMDFLVDGAVVGSSSSSPFSFSQNTTLLANGYHTFICKAYDAAGNSTASLPVDAYVVNARQVMIGVSGNAQSLGVAADASGTVAVGWWKGTVNFGTGDLVARGGGNTSESFIVKYNISNNNNPATVAWVKRLGGAASLTANSVVIDSQGKIIVVGGFIGTVDFDYDYSVTGESISSNGEIDIFVAKFTSDGRLEWVRGFGGAGVDQGMSVAVDGADNVFLGARLSSSIDTHFVGTVAGGDDIAVAKIPPNGSLNTADGFWGRRWGGSGLDYVDAIAVDPSGNVVATGSTTGGGTYDIFLSKYSGADGSLVWPMKVFPGPGNDYGNGIAVDPATGNIWVSGNSGGSVDFGDGQTQQQSAGMFLARYTPSGALQWKKILSTGASDTGNDLRIDNSGVLALAGVVLPSTLFGNWDTDQNWWIGNGNLNYFVATYAVPKATDPAGAAPTYRWGWRTGTGTDGYNLGYGVAFDSSNHLVTCGRIELTTNFGGITKTAPIATDQAFVAQYNK